MAKRHLGCDHLNIKVIESVGFCDSIKLNASSLTEAMLALDDRAALELANSIANITLIRAVKPAPVIIAKVRHMNGRPLTAALVTAFCPLYTKVIFIFFLLKSQNIKL